MQSNKRRIFWMSLCLGLVVGGYWGSVNAGEDDLEASSGSVHSGVTLDYFLSSGYAASDINYIPTVGRVEGTPEIDGDLSTAKSLYVVVPNDKIKLSPNEKLIVFGEVGTLREKHSGFHERLIKNFAILQVRNGMGRRYLADVVNSYDVIPNGSPVKLYDPEEELWENSQLDRVPPNHPITCFVAGGERLDGTWTQMQYIILTAGTKAGVVPGITFELWEIPVNEDIKIDGISRGYAKVFYAGAKYSIAQIQEGSGSIANGFEAIYQP